LVKRTTKAKGEKGLGAVAQLGERLPCTQEVSGSIPLSSTKYLGLNRIHFKIRSERFVKAGQSARFWF